MKYEPIDYKKLDWGRSTKKTRQNSLIYLQSVYGGEHIFRFAFLKLLERHPKEAMAFGFYFGYHSGNPITLKETAVHLNISSEYARNLACKAIHRFKIWRDEILVESGYMTREELFWAKVKRIEVKRR